MHYVGLGRGSLRYNAPEAVVFHPALFIQFWAHLWLIKFPPFADNTSPVLASHAISPPLSWHFMAIDGLVNGQSEKTFHLRFPWNLCGFSPPSLLPGRWFTGWSCILDWTQRWKKRQTLQTRLCYFSQLVLIFRPRARKTMREECFTHFIISTRAISTSAISKNNAFFRLFADFS